MGRATRALICVGAAGIWLLLLGFILFAAAVSRQLTAPRAGADAIVVLTGGSERRIETAIKLMRDGLGGRLLITGVNPRTRPADLLPLAGADIGECCIDLGYDALDTVGNASEARNWAAYHGFKRLLVVTSSYHMPRSLNELTLAMPGAELVAYPVMPRMLREGAWWLRPSTTRVLAGEYLKLVQSYARTLLQRALLMRDEGMPAPPGAASGPATALIAPDRPQPARRP